MMIPTEVADIATLIWPDWVHLDDEVEEDKMALDDIMAGAWRVYNAGYRKQDTTPTLRQGDRDA